VGLPVQLPALAASVLPGQPPDRRRRGVDRCARRRRWREAAAAEAEAAAAAVAVAAAVAGVGVAVANRRDQSSRRRARPRSSLDRTREGHDESLIRLDSCVAVHRDADRLLVWPGLNASWPLSG
jgi:hypothetical protein